MPSSTLTQPFSVLRSRGVYALELLLERRILLFVAADLVVVTQGLFRALLDPRTETGLLEGIYASMVVMPILLLGVPVASGAVALERRAGSLDLALAAPSTELYFVRRVAPVCGLLLVQAWLLLAVAYVIVFEGELFEHLLSPKGFFVLPLVIHAALSALLTGAVTLFWASRLSTTGAVMVAAFVTLLALSKWVFASPVLTGLGPSGSWLLGVVPPALVALGWNLGVLALASVLFYLYARQRLRRPEAMLT